MNKKILSAKLLVIGSALIGAMVLPALANAGDSKRGDTETAKVVLKSQFESQIKKPGRFEIRVAPIQLAARFYSFEFGYRLSKRWTTGPSAVVYDSPGNLGGMFGPTFHGAAFGWNASYYVEPNTSETPYFSIHGFYQNYTSYGHAFRGYSEHAGARADANFGYQWKISRFTLRTGLGVQYEGEAIRTFTPSDIAGATDSIESSNKSTLFPNVEIKLGIEI